MEDRYEIRGKIGQGGIGSVYRGYDTRMNREVAVKRILSSPEDPSLKDEATKQLVAEASALASLQHPHIVTIFDVGADEDGPYVVMELINGKTLDEIIEVAPMTFDDFRELAMQSQEALIAAHELDLIHSDLKPPNIMLSWLPSGKFQVKIVDFGLAVLAQSQSKEELESLEAVFGSIFFMPPEQFEREPLDQRSDLYSMGCVYYEALTGTYPFNGESGSDVMKSHLHHTVRPIRELRADVPIWLCEWVMWLINRYPDDRPETAREALKVFLQNDKNPNPEMSQGSSQAKRPKLIIPGSIPLADATPTQTAQPAAQPAAQPGKSSPKSLAPPDGSKPSVHSSSHKSTRVQASSEVTATATPTAAPTGALTATPTGVLTATPTVSPTDTDGEPTSQVQLASQASAGEKKAMSNSARIMIAVVLLILVVVGGLIFKGRMDQNKFNEVYNRLTAAASKEGAEEVAMNSAELTMLLEVASSTGQVEERDAVYHALTLAKATDGTDVDATIAQYATTNLLMETVRNKLIGDVLRVRANPQVLPLLIGYTKNTEDAGAIIATYQAIEDMVGDDHADVFLKVIANSKNAGVRAAAEKNLSKIIKDSSKRTYLTRRVATEYEKAGSRDARHAFIRMLGQCSTPDALSRITEVLKGSDVANQIAAISALSKWDDISAYAKLVDYIKGSSEPRTREKAIDAAIILLKKPENKDADVNKEQAKWKAFVALAKTTREKELMIRALANNHYPWSITLITPYKADSSEKIKKLAGGAIEHVKDQIALQAKGNK